MDIKKVQQIAKEKYGKELTDKQATEYANKYGKLTDSELDNISGGCGGEGALPCPDCGSENTSTWSMAGQVCGLLCNDCKRKY